MRKTHFLSHVGKRFASGLAPRRERPYAVVRIPNLNVLTLRHCGTGKILPKINVVECVRYIEPVMPQNGRTPQKKRVGRLHKIPATHSLNSPKPSTVTPRYGLRKRMPH